MRFTVQQALAACALVFALLSFIVVAPLLPVAIVLLALAHLL